MKNSSLGKEKHLFVFVLARAILLMVVIYSHVLFSIIIIILRHLKPSNCAGNFLNYKSLYYEAPKFDYSFVNVTFGIPRFSDQYDPGTALYSLGKTIATICQADLINRNKTQFSFESIINLAFQDYDSFPSSGQGATVALFSNDLSGDVLYSYLKRNESTHIAGMIGMYSYGSEKINSAVTNLFGIPFISSGDLARSNPDNLFTGYFPAIQTTFFQIFDTNQYNTFNAVLDLCSYFNWTVVANVFVSNSYGYERQRDIVTYAFNNSVPLFACQAIYYFDTTAKREDFDYNLLADEYCQCVSDKSKVQVTMLWMGTTAATSFIQLLRSRCSAADNWTFVVTEDFQTTYSLDEEKRILKNSLLLRSNVPNNFVNFIQECQDGATPAAKSAISELWDGFTNLGYNCTTKYDPNLEVCTSIFKNRGETCYCSLDRLNTDPYLSVYFYSADVVSMYAEAVRLLTKNCTYLNEVVEEEYRKDISVADFCKLTSFTPAILAVAMRYVNFTGYTGEIYFGKKYMIREIKNYYLFSAYSDNYDAVLVGTLNSTSVQINISAIQFVNGKMPISRIVPQNMDLSYAVVDVFFALSILFMIICTITLIILFVYRNNLCMRKTSPIVTLLMLTGLALTAFAQFTQSFAKTDAWCVIQVYFFHLGMTLLISGALAKTYRIYRIFANKTAVAISISEWRLLGIMAVITGVYIAGLTVFVTVFGLDAVIMKSSTNIYYQYVSCTIPNATWEELFQFYVRLYTLFIIIITLIFAWLTRKVRSDYRDSKTLTAFICVLTATFIILVPLELTFGDETDSELFRYVIMMEFYTIVIVSALGLLFFPKIFEIYKENKKKVSRSTSNINR